MAGKNDHDDLGEISNVMGGREAQVIPGAAFDPPKPKMPERPKQNGIAPPYPLVPADKIHQYTEEAPRKFEEVFAANQTGKFDPDLNELALKDVAAEQGITVEELLKQKGRKLEKKIEAAKMEQQMSVEQMRKLVEQADAQKTEEIPEAQAEVEGPSELDIELEELELKRKELELKKKKALQEAKSLEKKKELRNPILDKMRQKLSLDRLDPAKVELEGIAFELMPPPTSIHPWILGQLSLAQQSGEDALTFALKICTACAATVRIDGSPTAEVLGLAEPGSIKDWRFPAPDMRLLTAQTLFEMFQGDPTLDDKFRFSPDVALKLYQAFTLKFRDMDIKSSLDLELYVYQCQVPGCKEEHEDLKEDMKLFCRLHGVDLQLRGKKQEVMSLPLP